MVRRGRIRVRLAEVPEPHSGWPLIPGLKGPAPWARRFLKLALRDVLGAVMFLPNASREGGPALLIHHEIDNELHPITNIDSSCPSNRGKPRRPRGAKDNNHCGDEIGSSLRGAHQASVKTHFVRLPPCSESNTAIGTVGSGFSHRDTGKRNSRIRSEEDAETLPDSPRTVSGNTPKISPRDSA